MSQVITNADNISTSNAAEQQSTRGSLRPPQPRTEIAPQADAVSSGAAAPQSARRIQCCMHLYVVPHDIRSSRVGGVLCLGEKEKETYGFSKIEKRNHNI